MRHLKTGKKFGRKAPDRRLFMQSLAQNLVQCGRVETTVARAKELRRFIERLITYGKKGDISGLRQLRRKVPAGTAYRIYHELAPRYADRRGGYTRIIKSGHRVQDGAEKAIIEFV